MKQPANKKGTSSSRSSKFIIGAIAGAALGGIAIVAVPRIAPYVLVALIIVAAYVAITSSQRGKAKKWAPHKFSAAPAMGALVIGVLSIVGVNYLGASFAWHPEGGIKKTVRNVTANGQAQDANTDATAVSAKPGDILDYTVTVNNSAPAANDQYNDLAFVKMTDNLPAGVELVSDASKRTVTASMGTIKPGKSASVTFQVKVTSTVNGSKIKNTACYEGDSVVKDNPQYGCDDAIIKITVPPTPPPPPAPTPVYSCDLLTLTKGTGRAVTAKVDYTAKDGATFSKATFDWGDGTTPTTGAQTTTNHTYEKDGTYTVTATVIVNANGVEKTATGAGCSKPITFSTTTPPPPPPPAPTPVYSCDLLTLTKGEGRKVTAKVDYTAKDGATFNKLTFDWGDDTTPTTTGQTEISHTYGKDGNYTVSATLTVIVNDTAKTIVGPMCSKPVSFTTDIPPTPPTPTPPTPTPPTPQTPETPSVLPNTGPGTFILIALFAVVAGYIATAVYGSKKNNRAIKFKSNR